MARALTWYMNRLGPTLQSCFPEWYKEWLRDLKLGDLKLIRCQTWRLFGQWDNKRLSSPKESKMNLTCHAITQVTGFWSMTSGHWDKKAHQWRAIQSKAMSTGVGWRTEDRVRMAIHREKDRRNKQKHLCQLDKSAWTKAHYPQIQVITPCSQ